MVFKAGLLAATCLLSSAAVSAAPSAAGLEAGAGRAEIALTPAMLPIDGFGTIHDPLQARAAIVAAGSARVAMVVVDLTSIGDDLVAEMKAVVAKTGGLRPEDVLVIAGHTFSAPHIFTGPHLPPNMMLTADEAARTKSYHDAAIAAVTAAATQAATRMQAATLTVGTGIADVNVNRNVAMADGWWLGTGETGYSDKQLGVIRLDDRAHNPIAILLDYAVQSSVMDHSKNAGGSKTVTADLEGDTVKHVENRFGGNTVALFMTGAAGDQAPGYTARTYRYDNDGHSTIGDIGDAGFTLVTTQGGRLGEAAVRTAQAASSASEPRTLRVVEGSVSLEAQQRPHDLAQIKPTRSYTYVVSGRSDAPYVVLQIGDTALVGVQAELSASLGADIRRRSPFAHTLVATMVNGAAKYLPDADSYRKFTYEAMNSSYAPGSGEAFANRIVDALAAMHAKAAN